MCGRNSVGEIFFWALGRFFLELGMIFLIYVILFISRKEIIVWTVGDGLSLTINFAIRIWAFFLCYGQLEMIFFFHMVYLDGDIKRIFMG